VHVCRRGIGTYVGFVSDVERSVWCVVCLLRVVDLQGVKAKTHYVLLVIAVNMLQNLFDDVKRMNKRQV
jgi:hypothetical protein